MVEEVVVLEKEEVVFEVEFVEKIEEVELVEVLDVKVV